MRNFLLQPLLQVRIGLYHVVLTISFAVTVYAYLHAKMAEFSEVVETLTESDAAVGDLIRSYLLSVGIVTVGIGIVFVFVSLAVSVFFTHKMVGPTIAFRRHIQSLKAGNYEVRVKLRHGDSFQEVADDLNDLAKELGQGAKSKKVS
jgi:signal transduction histidine kinase